MHDETSNPAAQGYSPSFEATVLSSLSSLREEVKGGLDDVRQDIKDLKESQTEHRKETTAIQLDIADRRNQCPLVTSCEKSLLARIRPLEEGALVVKGGYKAVAGIASGVVVIMTVLYHLFGIGKVIAAILPKGN